MNNIHVLPTDKPSRLSKSTSKEELTFCSDIDNLSNNQNIYITSDEEIKEGDWMIRDNEQPIKVTKDFFWDFGVRYYKIILTTDQNLIKDGVQAIDDEFLEWFIKNQSCEEVKILRCPIDGLYTIDLIKLILKEEFKQDKIMERFIANAKQETLEEVAEKYVNSFEFGIAHPRRVAKKSFINGAKWQQERSYSEEEVKNLTELFLPYYFKSDKGFDDAFNEWFEQFKKK